MMDSTKKSFEPIRNPQTFDATVHGKCICNMSVVKPEARRVNKNCPSCLCDHSWKNSLDRLPSPAKEIVFHTFIMDRYVILTTNER